VGDGLAAGGAGVALLVASGVGVAVTPRTAPVGDAAGEIPPEADACVGDGRGFGFGVAIGVGVGAGPFSVAPGWKHLAGPQFSG
jgi:hypothetical protein